MDSRLALTNKMRPVKRHSSPQANGQMFVPSQDLLVLTRTGVALLSNAGAHHIGIVSGSLHHLQLVPGACAWPPLNLDAGSLGTLAAGQRHLADAWNLEQDSRIATKDRQILIAIKIKQ